MRIETTPERAAQDVVRWRREQLAGSGFPSPLAARLAKDARYDLHALIELTASSPVAAPEGPRARTATPSTRRSTTPAESRARTLRTLACLS
jgi:hypothetical protein